jgi:Beta propeller domain
MGRRAIATVGLGVAAGITLCAGLLPTLGGSGPVARVAQSLAPVPSAAADELPAFDDCEQLRRWYVRAALPQVGSWGLGGPPVLYRRAMPLDGRVSPAAGAPDTAQSAVGSSGTGTNVQDADVDESDVAKTDGRILVRVVARELVVTDVSGSRPRELSRTTLPGRVVVHPELLLHGDRVLVVGGELSTPFLGPITQRGKVAGDLLPPRMQDSRTRLLSVDLADPSAPRVSDDRSVDGSAVSTREYADGTVRVVLRTGYPTLHFVHPDRDHTAAQATEANRTLVRDAPIDTWLPAMHSGAGPDTPLLGCSDVRHPLRPSGPGLVTVLSFPVDDVGQHTATAVTTSGDLVYSSADRLYVGTASTDRTTAVHAFALDGARTSYVGSGSVPGTVRDRWSFDAYDGHLRVASTTGLPGSATSNGVTVLTERGGRLVRTGRLDGLGTDEQTKAVRWFGPLAVVVTFRQTDPLYTLDLSDPARPRVLGRLRAPGYSSYLHPVGDHLLVGIGHDATTTGADLGGQAATFDLRDPGAVRRVDTLGLGRRSSPAAEWDARAFTYLPDQRTLVTAMQGWTGGSRFVAVHVARDGQLGETSSWRTTGYPGSDVRALPLGDGRVALLDGSVRVVQVD